MIKFAAIAVVGLGSPLSAPRPDPWSAAVQASNGSPPAGPATATGIGCAAITAPGAFGIRGDNARFRFHAFQVRVS